MRLFCHKTVLLGITHQANIAHLNQQWQTAIDLYKQALEIDPKYYIALFNLGLTHQNYAERLSIAGARNAHLSSAHSAFEAAQNLRPNEPAVRAHLGIVAHYRHEYQQAIEHFDRAIQSTTDPLIKADYHYNKATSLMALGRDEEAREAYLRCINGKPEHFAAHYNLGTLAIKMGDLTTADEHLAQAAMLDPAATRARGQSCRRRFATRWQPTEQSRGTFTTCC